MRKRYLYLAVLSVASVSLRAQQSSLPILQTQVDQRSAALGNSHLSDASDHFIYSNPVSFVRSSRKAQVSYSLTVMPKATRRHPLLQAVSTAYRWKRHAFFVGFRHIGSEAIERVNASGTTGKSIHPYDYTLDVGYAHQFSPHFSLYGVGSYIQSYQGKTAYTGCATLGAQYDHPLRLWGNAGHYSLGASLRHWGGKVKYGSSSYDMPSAVSLYGSLSTDKSARHRAALYSSFDYRLLPSSTKSWQTAVGAEYTYRQTLSARVGYNANKYDAFITCGLGYQTQHFQLHATWQHSSAVDIYGVGLSFQY